MLVGKRCGGAQANLCPMPSWPLLPGDVPDHSAGLEEMAQELSSLVTALSCSEKDALIHRGCQSPPTSSSPPSAQPAFASLKYAFALYKLKPVKYLITAPLHRVFYFMLC